MSDIILSIENVSKQYQLGKFGTKTIGGDVNRWWHKVRGKDDPYLKIGATNDRTSKEKTDFVWALQDINFEVKRGEVLGIIGKNGAGKSTLLKLLSRVTGPTTGSIRSSGRMASLLEVGTGFHPELTGRENIFLNGAILGMTKAEIKSKLDDIIDFSGCALYIDTPVKRYSSGMTVRLGFAVASFLDPEILVVDEVLAVGDAEFQKKAIGKMKDVSKGEGRTVLFVSHNMASVKSLCTRGLVLENGLIKATGPTDEMIKLYLGGNSVFLNYREVNHTAQGLHIKSFEIKNRSKKVEDPISREDEIELLMRYENNTNASGLYWNIKIKDGDGNYLIGTTSLNAPKVLADGKGIDRMIIPKKFLNEGEYAFDIRLMVKTENGYKDYYNEKDVLMINVIPEARPMGTWLGRAPEALNPQFNWITE